MRFSKNFEIALGVMVAQVVFITNERFDSATQRVCSEKAASAALTPMPYAGQRLTGLVRDYVPLQSRLEGL